jgi:hypothetical protein
MSKIYVSLNLQTKQWGIAPTNITPKYIDVYFGFTRKAKSPPTEFNGLSFGAIIQNQEEIVHHVSYPKPGIEYKSTVNDYIETFRIENLERNSKYNMLFWVVNDGVKSQYVYTLTTPYVDEITDYEVE